MGEVVRPELYDQRSDTGKITDWVDLGMASTDKPAVVGTENGSNTSITGENFAEVVTATEIIDDSPAAGGSKLALKATVAPLQLTIKTPVRERATYAPPNSKEMSIDQVAEQAGLNIDELREISQQSGVAIDILVRQAIRSPRIRNLLE